MSYAYSADNRQQRRPIQGMNPNMPAYGRNPAPGHPQPPPQQQQQPYVKKNQYSHNNYNNINTMPQNMNGPVNYYNSRPAQMQYPPQQQSYYGSQQYKNPGVQYNHNNAIRSPQFDQFPISSNNTTPMDETFHFEQPSPRSPNFPQQQQQQQQQQEVKPSLPPKIPVISASPSIETLNVKSNNDNSDPFSQGFYQNNHSSSSGDSSVDDLIDRYMEGVSLLDDSDSKKNTKRPLSEIRTQKMRPASMIKELETVDSPPPYEELEPQVSNQNFPQDMKKPLQAPMRDSNSNLEGSSSSTRLPITTVKSNDSRTSSMKSLPYPTEDPLAGMPVEEPPKTRPRRYTDELLEEVQNLNENKIDPAVMNNRKRSEYNILSEKIIPKLDPIENFIITRNEALQDFKSFSLNIQLKWAKVLLEAIENTKIISCVNINGHRIQPLTNVKEIKKNKIIFLNTSMKVLKRLSEKHDDAESQAILGDLYSGYTLLDISEKNIQRGFEYYLKATKGKHPNATYKTGCCVEHGMGTKRDIEKCFHFYEKSALLGDLDGMCKLGIVYIKGLLQQQKSAQKSVYWLNKAILTNEGAVLPIFILAKIHETDIATLDLRPHKIDKDADVIRELQKMQIYCDTKTALQLYLKAAKLGHIKSQGHLGYCYEYGAMKCAVNPRTSIYWYSKAALKGDLNSEMGLSGWYLTGAEGLLKQSDTEAYLWARKASEKGLAKAEYALGYFNEIGVGTKKDLNEAKKWYKIAASQGYTKAVKKLENWR